MKILYLDCFSGISGDMTLGALLDMGLDADDFRNELSKLNLQGYDLAIEKKNIKGITGTDVTVTLTEEYQQLQQHILEHNHPHPHGSAHEHDHGHDHEHEHNHEHDHEHNHENDQEHNHEHNHEHTHDHSMRNLKDIEMILDWSDLNPGVKERSKRIFREIARAEAKVHGKDIHEVHFHEVGAIDSIVDITGTAICLDMLGIDKVFASSLHDGRGFITCQHGIIPVPVPAVMEMLAGSGIPFVQEEVDTELVTPTGMGILKCLAEGYGNMPPMRVENTGYGLGKRETGRLNALRAVIGTLSETDSSPEEIAVLETNVDDMSAEYLGYALEKLLENGALDVFFTPIYMKKSRPAFMMTVLTSLEKERELADLILKETSTLGIRRTTAGRYCMARKVITVSTPVGEIRVKVASGAGIVKAAPEYEDCREAARRSGLPIARVYELAAECSREQLQQ